MRIVLLTLLATAPLVASCDAFGPEDVQVVLRTGATAYPVPAAVSVAVINQSPGTIHHGVCFVRERRHGADWVADPPDEGVSCSLPRAITRPGQQRELSAYVPQPGEYRLLLWVSTADEERVDTPFISNAFTVAAPTK